MSARSRTTRFYVRNRHPVRRLNTPLFRRLIRAALTEPPIVAHAAVPGEVGVILTDAAEMARINEAHLGHTGPTDVITFDYREPSDPPEALRGEILICWEVADRQAGEYETVSALEIVRYLVHGLLHLCGYDDRTAADRREMKRHENRLVTRLAERFEWSALERTEMA